MTDFNPHPQKRNNLNQFFFYLLEIRIILNNNETHELGMQNPMEEDVENMTEQATPLRRSAAGLDGRRRIAQAFWLV